MKRIGFASALALAVLASGCVTRVVYTPAPPPPPASPMIVQSAPPAPQPPAPSADAQSAQAAAPQPTEAAAPQPAPTAPPPSAPAVAVESVPATAPPPGYVPDYYVWDGYEYVGVYGDQYVYWSGGAWVMCPPTIVVRFHSWERYHPGWYRGPSHYYYRGRGRWR